MNHDNDFQMENYLHDHRINLLYFLIVLVTMSLCVNVVFGEVAAEPFALPWVGVVQIIALIGLVCCTIRLR